MLRLRAEEMREPTLTLCEQSVRKSLIQRQMELENPRSNSLDTSMLGRMVLNAELKSTNNSIVPLQLQMGQSSVEGCCYGIFCGPIDPISKLVWVKPGWKM